MCCVRINQEKKTMEVHIDSGRRYLKFYEEEKSLIASIFGIVGSMTTRLYCLHIQNR